MAFFFGWGATGAKVARKGAKVADNLADGAKITDKLSDAKKAADLAKKAPAPKGPVEKIFKAPQPGKGQKLLDEGFDPNDFPLDELNDGRAYFGKQRQLADKYDDVYGDGVLELEILKDIYDARIRPHEVPYLSDPNFHSLMMYLTL